MSIMKRRMSLLAGHTLPAQFTLQPMTKFGGSHTDIDTIKHAISKVSKKSTQLNIVFNNFTRDFGPIESIFKEFIQTLNKAITKVSRSSLLNLPESLDLHQSFRALTSNMRQAIKEAIAKKQSVVISGDRSKVKENFQYLNATFNVFINSIAIKVPREGQALFMSLTSGIKVELQRAIDAFAQSSGPNLSAWQPDFLVQRYSKRASIAF